MNENEIELPQVDEQGQTWNGQSWVKYAEPAKEEVKEESNPNS